MLKPTIPLALVFAVIAFPALARYDGWQEVRIMDEVPDEECEYKIQEICNYDNIECLEWFKKRATTHGANVVVMPLASTLALADYYYCPSVGPERV